MSFIKTLFGYPKDQLTPINAYIQNHANRKIFCGVYKQGRKQYEYHLDIGGVLPQDWCQDAVQMQSAFNESIKKGRAKHAFMIDIPTPGKPEQHVFILNTETSSRHKEGDGLASFHNANIILRLITDKQLNDFDEKLALSGGVDFLTRTVELLKLSNISHS